MVYTTRSPGSTVVSRGYRIAVGIKCGLGSWSSAVGFSKLYYRVKGIASAEIATRTCSKTRETPVGIIYGHSWGRFGAGGGVGSALVVMGVRCGLPVSAGEQDRPEPTEEALRSPGGASLEELTALAPQRADEVYNEFDFTEPNDRGLITLSYGEPISPPAFDFEPTVERAERLAANYHSLLSRVGEVRSSTLRVIGREWFFANQDFATVHICFDR